MLSGDTIFALSSGRPPAAVAIIRTSGPQAFAACEAIAGRLPAPRRPVLKTLRSPKSGEEIDQALVLRFDGPKSATGENVVEYQCHGSRAVVDSLLGVMTSLPGMRQAEPGEFTRRAFANGRIDLTEAEGLADLLEAETESQRRAALLMAEGGLRKQIEAWRQRLVDLSARAEAAIDYVGDEDETAADEHVLGQEAKELAAELALWLARPRAEPLREGVRVVVAGPPNAGKSSLVNALAEAEKAIVTDVAGTTRDVIEVPLAIDGIPIVLVDTAGLRESRDAVEAIGVDRAQGQLQCADLILWLGEPASAPDLPRVIRVHARADDPGRGDGPEGSLPVSSVTGKGLAALVQAIVAAARAILPAEGELALNRRQSQEIELAREGLAGAGGADLVMLAEGLRSARSAFDRLGGRSGVEDVLDALFGRFCLGK
ncbi:tRNA uridine-5-carboxymethylaminomethyl(34) synthesis GTPase MnmE [Sphingomonas alba]|uniref:tRNA modification GTPase MnmE n=1 Tax=Sphingomonas alba TaxID=2908208 RepID=A0ABT0RMX5_9SPHN|nr:tRNA uridine-5-carboxymethylaminomethyl(34) synthesis GTPase MnmE [Sphingomonas alba]MCL6683827.1 tRNA uridine-5-carboxymethylaminomethyl(34) synthesis GTPase MnmE [Sphingomonas alba]